MELSRKGRMITMYCSKCGAPLPDGSNFCTRCGTATNLAAQNTAAPPSPAEPAESQRFSNLVERPTENPYAAYRPQAPQGPAFPMKWFKFTIYFQLFANVVLNLFNALSSLLGLAYGTDAEMVYRTYPGIHTLDMLTGILCLALAVFALVTRFQLAKFKKRGPLMLCIFLACNLVAELFYMVAASIVTGISFLNPTSISSAVTLIVLILCNHTYYNKRRELFTN